MAAGDDDICAAIEDFLRVDDNLILLADSRGNKPAIRLENTNFTKPNPPAPWIAMALTGILYGQESIGAGEQGDNRWDESGHLWLNVMIPSGTGARAGRGLAKRIARLFRGLHLLDDSLEFGDTFIGEGGPAKEEGNWFELPVMIEWRRIDAP